MNRSCVAISLFLLSLIFSIISIFNTRNICEKITLATKNLESSIMEEKEPEEIFSNIEKLEEEWNKSYKILSIYISHQHLETAEQLTNSIKKYAEIGELDIVITNCNQIEKNLEHLFRSEKPTIENIF